MLKASNDNYVKFREFHEQNPLVYELIQHYALKLIDQGFEHYSIQSLYERVRWHTEIETKGDSFKINNNHRPFYARMFMNDHPEHDGFFRTREVKGVA